MRAHAQRAQHAAQMQASTYFSHSEPFMQARARAHADQFSNATG
eukprot:COSAG06_NODE_64122_length_260_cov_0.919255_2_plen_43_part_01